MNRTTTGHPVRAMRGGAMLLIGWLAYRSPEIEREFAADVAAAEAKKTVRPLLAVAQPVDRAAVAARGDAIPILSSDMERKLSVTEVRKRRRLRQHNSIVAVGLAVREAAIAPVSALIAPPPQRTPGDAPVLADAGDLATRAYAALATGHRRDAARLFDAAVAIGDPRTAAWQAQRDALTRRWSANAYSVVRARGGAGLAATPVLGGGQSGAAIAYTPDPLAGRPFALTARATVAHDDARGALAAVGIAWHPLPGVTIAGERLLALGPAARSDWTVRIAGGAATLRGIAEASAYGEAGIVGSSAYAAAQAHAGLRFNTDAVVIIPGGGAWASVQRNRRQSVDRVDLGPGLIVRAGDFTLATDYRFRVTGSAAPGSGPVVTLTAAF